MELRYAYPTALQFHNTQNIHYRGAFLLEDQTGVFWEAPRNGFGLIRPGPCMPRNYPPYGSRHSWRLPSLPHIIPRRHLCFFDFLAFCNVALKMSKFKGSDIESQLKDEKGPQLLTPRLDSEYRVPTTKKFAYLAVYFLCNVSLTIYNKAVLGKV